MVRKVVNVTLWLPVALLAVLLVIDAAYTPECTAPVPPGTEIEIPGEWMQVLAPADEDTLVLDVIREPFNIPDYALPAADGHIHPHQAETFEVVSGRARFLIGDEYVELGPGESGTVPPGTVHHWMALDGEPVRVRATFTPALNADRWFVEFQGRLAANRMDLIQAAVIAREYPQSSPLPVSPPGWLWSGLSRLLAPIGRAAGYTAC